MDLTEACRIDAVASDNLGQPRQPIRGRTLASPNQSPGELTDFAQSGPIHESAIAINLCLGSSNTKSVQDQPTLPVQQ